jgi:hypothetical protein
MRKPATLAVAAMLAVSAVPAASAANHMSSRNKTTGASDTLTLSDSQQKSIWNDVSRRASNETAPSGFNASVGTVLPSDVSTRPLPRRAARDVPAVKPYRYAMMQDKLLIVNPSDHKIADIVSK